MYSESKMEELMKKMIEEDSIRLKQEWKVANYFSEMKSFYNDQE